MRVFLSITNLRFIALLAIQYIHDILGWNRYAKKGPHSKPLMYTQRSGRETKDWVYVANVLNILSVNEKLPVSPVHLTQDNI